MVEGRVVDIDRDSRSLSVRLSTSKEAAFEVGETVDFRVGLGDIEIGYKGRRIRGEATEYGGRWNLERIFPLDDSGMEGLQQFNRRFHAETAKLGRREVAREGDLIPRFAGIDQSGRVFPITELKGKPFVINFIFTRCRVPEMCPASTARMAELQEAAAQMNLDRLNFVTVSFDPEFDSPGVLKQYAEGYGIDTDNFHLLTGTQQWADDVLRRFGILTIEEDGTINHTMATLLIDGTGRVAYRKEGPSWTVEGFLEAAKAL